MAVATAAQQAESHPVHSRGSPRQVLSTQKNVRHTVNMNTAGMPAIRNYQPVGYLRASQTVMVARKNTASVWFDRPK